jgi:hypothetical protein
MDHATWHYGSIIGDGRRVNELNANYGLAARFTAYAYIAKSEAISKSVFEY